VNLRTVLRTDHACGPDSRAAHLSQLARGRRGAGLRDDRSLLVRANMMRTAASARLLFLIGLLQADGAAAQEACNLGSMSATITAARSRAKHCHPPMY
jgi:hypothetical protein